MTSMKEIGEKEFLRGLLPTLVRGPNFINGFGHDASIIDVGLGKAIAFKVDRAPYPIAVNIDLAKYEVWGRLAVTANISDLLAVGSEPKAFMVSIVVPGSWDSQSVREIVAGCQESCADYSIEFLGGDTKEGNEAQVVGTAIGVIDREYHIGRELARPGDLLVVAGYLGGFVGAYMQLKRSPANSPPRPALIEYISHPFAKVAECKWISSRKLARSGCDLSDGLCDALDSFCSNDVGVLIDSLKLPLHDFALESSRLYGIEPHRFAFGVGDWSAAFVVSQSDLEIMRRDCPPEVKLATVGVFTSTKERLLKLPDGQVISVPRIINEHFRDKLEDEGSYIFKF